METKSNIFYIYFQKLNKSILRKKEFHSFLSMLDIIIIIIKIMNIYKSNYNAHLDKVYKELSPVLFISKYSIIIRILPVSIYLVLVYLISIISILYGGNKKLNKYIMIIINILELLFIRIFFIFFCEFLFYLPTLYFIIFFMLSIPFLIFIFIDMTYFHLGLFMPISISFPFDAFTSICDREKIIIKIFISISSISGNVHICKFMYFSQFVLLICFCSYLYFQQDRSISSGLLSFD